MCSQQKKDLPNGRPSQIRDQGFEYAIRGSKTEKWRKTAKERGSDASPAVVTYSVTYFLTSIILTSASVQQDSSEISRKSISSI